MELTQYVGEQIRELRTSHSGGLSQEALAKALQTTSNTISRWETGTYRPSLEDLDALSRFFGVSILQFFPKEEEVTTESKVTALLRAARDLPEDDLDELQKYAEFRKARSMINHTRKKTPGRPRSA